MVTTKPPTALLLTGQTGPQFYFSTLRLNTSSYREGISQQSANIKALMKQTHMPSGLQYNNFYLPFPCTKDKLLVAFADSKNRLKFLDLVIIKKVADHVKFLTSSTISKRKTRSTIPISPSPTMVTSFLSAPALEPSSHGLFLFTNFSSHLFYLPCFVGWQLHSQNTFPFQRGRNTVLQ
ncbi:hypothetical protein PCASD_00332 [Puccinia coronata f. sp. avenae]|uniref:Uncharacterized protein n=1 Tax=Puccinia coronata f. sp. avenae TaxID=200324 RepID=A0A2N5TH05_9BASI|nr:hypothetical protein PCASD_05200 [Puccinia coronata f. sp. avenae]PLW51548.1 hypothetical protein PCASD_00332 [Puccinia coronata f. sp. avenae]